MTQKLLLLLLFVVCTMPLHAQSSQAINTYQNPVIAGDIPDPTIIRVGDTYIAAGTTSDFEPNYPLYESDDLINWKQIGFIFDEKPEWTQGAFWAPELFYKDGTYFVYYTAKRKSDGESCIGVATTTDIHQPFQDHGILIEWGNEAIDAYIFEDVDGKLYISWKAYGLNPNRPIEILASELSQDGMSLLGEHFTLTDHEKGWQGNGDEGQCLLKHGEYYYLFYSTGGCCDNRCSYAVHVSRSKDLKSGWEQYNEGPIMHGGDKWLCTGHGTMVQTPDQRYFYMYHSYNARDFEYVGRQAMLDEVVWDEETGWPYFKYGNTPSKQAPVPFEDSQQERKTNYRDDFSKAKSDLHWQWDIKGIRPEINRSNGTLSLTNQGEQLSFIGISPKSGMYSMETKLAESNATLKGLCVYGNQDNLLGLGMQGNQLQLIAVKGGERQVLFEQQISNAAAVYLKMEAVNARFYKFYWSEDGQQWKALDLENGVVEGSFLPQWGVAMRAGLMLDQGNDAKASFTYFELQNEFK